MEKNIPFSRKKVSIIIVNYNGWEDVRDAIWSISEKEHHRRFQIIVIDNASREDKREELLKICCQLNCQFFDPTGKEKLTGFPSFSREVIFKRLTYNKGFGGGNNEGIEIALSCGADYVWLLNSDTLLHDLAFSHLLAVAEALGPSTVIVGSKLHCYPETEKVQFDGNIVSYCGIKTLSPDHNQIKQVKFVSGASMLIRSKFLKKHGLLGEDYFLYFEDNEVCLRAARLGYGVIYNPHSIVYHKGGSSIGAFMDSPQSLYYGVRNSLFFHDEFGIPPTLFDQLKLTEKFAETVVSQQNGQEKTRMIVRGIRDFLLDRRGPIKEDADNEIPKSYERLKRLEDRFIENPTNKFHRQAYFDYVRMLIW